MRRFKKLFWGWVFVTGLCLIYLVVGEKVL